MTAAEIRSAATELVVLAARMREDWDEADIWQAIADRQGAGWRFPEIALGLVRFAVSASTTPAGVVVQRKPQRGRRKRKSTFAAVRPCVPQMVALVTAMREDWDAKDVRAALKGCYDARWSVAQAVLELVRLAAMIPGSEPRDLAAAAASTFGRRTTGDRRG